MPTPSVQPSNETIKIATWNVNGIKARLDNVLAWLCDSRPDIACLQEIKSIDDAFPRSEIEQAGYHIETYGQKGFNGVALLSRTTPDEVSRGLAGDEDDIQSRMIEGVFTFGERIVRVASIYLPNGNPVDSAKYPYKLAWMDRLTQFAESRMALEEPFVLAGDYNVIPEPFDCHDPRVWEGDALFLPETRQAFRRLETIGLSDALRATTESAGLYTFWDYQSGAWQKNNGIRIDHMMLSPEAACRLRDCGIDKHVRGWERPSDHVPVYIHLAI